MHNNYQLLLITLYVGRYILYCNHSKLKYQIESNYLKRIRYDPRQKLPMHLINIGKW